MAGVGKLRAFALDCPDPRALATFYVSVTGWKLEDDPDNGWVTLRNGGDGPAFCFQRADEYAPPRWPGADHPQQAHVDIGVPDLDAAEQQVLALGARKADEQPGTSWRVFLDPVGHPFCLCQD